MTVEKIISDFRESEIFIETPSRALDTLVTGISAVEESGPGELVFVDKASYLEHVEKKNPSVIVTTKEIRASLKENREVLVFIAANVSLAHALLKQKYASRDYRLSGWSGVHPTAVIHETAEIGFSTVIEPKVVIGKNAKVGEGCRIMAGVVIENDAVIGDDTILHPNVVVGYGCRVGKGVVIEAGSVLGSEGYSFAQDKSRQSHAIPQTGIVVLEDRVRVGANNCIDRAAYKETRIGAGTKLDNLCHIAHNVQIGKDCLLTAFFCCAGSSKIGDRVIASGQAGVLDHMTIANDVVLLHRAGVSKDIEKPGAYAGLPVQPLQEYFKNNVILRNAVELRKRIIELEKKIEAMKTL